MKIYRQVHCSDRLPDVKGDYDTDCGSLAYRVRINKWGYGVYSQPVKYWLEEIKLPTEEEIEQYISDNKADVEGPISELVNAGFRSGVEWLLSKLK